MGKLQSQPGLISPYKGLVCLVYRHTPASKRSMIQGNEVLVVGPHIPQVSEADGREMVVLCQDLSGPKVKLVPFSTTPRERRLSIKTGYVDSDDLAFRLAILEFTKKRYAGPIPLFDLV